MWKKLCCVLLFFGAIAHAEVSELQKSTSFKKITSLIIGDGIHANIKPSKNKYLKVVYDNQVNMNYDHSNLVVYGKPWFEQANWPWEDPAYIYPNGPHYNATIYLPSSIKFITIEKHTALTGKLPRLSGWTLTNRSMHPISLKHTGNIKRIFNHGTEAIKPIWNT